MKEDDMKLGVKESAAEARRLLAGCETVKEITETKGETQIVVFPVSDVSLVRNELERRLGQGKITWLS